MPLKFNPFTNNFDIVTSGGGGGTYEPTVSVATTDPLNSTYDNGVDGVGATLTNAGALAALSVDGESPVVGSRVLVKDQANPFENGIYTVTIAGDGATAWVLTRASNYDEPVEIKPGDVIPVLDGSENADTIWQQIQEVSTIGTDDIIFVRFRSSQFQWIDQASSTDALAFTGYFSTSAITMTLPSAPAQGETIAFIADSAGELEVQAPAGQFIRIGDQISSSGGTATNSAQGDALTLVYRASTSTWLAEASPVGAWLLG